MPYKHIEKKIPKEYDKRVKLTETQRKEIRHIYFKEQSMSQRGLAKAYKVSRRLIVFVLYPERQKANYEACVARGGSKLYYDKEKNTIAQRKHRKYKQELYLKGELK